MKWWCVARRCTFASPPHHVIPHDLHPYRCAHLHTFGSFANTFTPQGTAGDRRDRRGPQGTAGDRRGPQGTAGDRRDRRGPQGTAGDRRCIRCIWKLLCIFFAPSVHASQSQCTSGAKVNQVDWRSFQMHQRTGEALKWCGGRGCIVHCARLPSANDIGVPFNSTAKVYHKEGLANVHRRCNPNGVASHGEDE